MAETIAHALKAIAEKSTTPDDEKALLQKLASEPEPAYAALASLVRGSKLPIEDRKTIAELAAKLTEEHKWMTPRELDESRVSADGEMHAFLEWASELQTLQRQFDANPKAGATAHAGRETSDRSRHAALDLQSLQRRAGPDRRAGADHAPPEQREVSGRHCPHDQGSPRETKRRRACRSSSSTSFKAISTYWNDVPQEDRHDPDRGSQVRRTLHRVASRQFGVGAAQGVPEVEAGPT